MTQTELNREVASRTGETNRTISQRGFSLLEIPCPPPLIVDWDALDALRPGLLPDRNYQLQTVG